LTELHTVIYLGMNVTPRVWVVETDNVASMKRACMERVRVDMVRLDGARVDPARVDLAGA
jgi:hypothetical protein